MADYLPSIYSRFRSAYPGVAASLDTLASGVESTGPLDERSLRLVKLGIAIGSQSAGGVRSSVRKAIELGLTADEIRQASLLAITTAGFPTAIAALGWIDEVINEEVINEDGA